MTARKRKITLVVLSVSVLVTFALACKMIGRENRASSEAAGPVVVDPGEIGRPPSDAVVLFDGHDLSQWRDAGHWVVKDGTATVGAGYGGITTKRAFGDCQLHLEWATPSIVEGSGQARGNSGVYLQERYEIQVLDSFQNQTYPDGMAGAVYGQYAPLVNASASRRMAVVRHRFQGPAVRFSGETRRTGFRDGPLQRVLVQNHVEIKGDPGGDTLSYTPHPRRCLCTSRTTDARTLPEHLDPGAVAAISRQFSALRPSCLLRCRRIRGLMKMSLYWMSSSSFTWSCSAIMP